MIAKYSSNPAAEFIVIHSVKSEYQNHFSSFIQDECSSGRFPSQDMAQIGLMGNQFDPQASAYCQSPTWELFSWMADERYAFLLSLRALEARYHGQYPGRS